MDFPIDETVEEEHESLIKMDFPIDETVEEEHESLIKMDFSIDETVKDEQESLIHPFSEDELSDSHSGTGSSKYERRRKRQRSSSSDCESNNETEVPKRQEDSGTGHLHLNSDSDVELTNTEKKVKKKVQRALRKHKRPPKIKESNLMALLEKLKNTPKLSKQRRNQMDCVQSLHSSKNPMWTSPSVVLAAVKDCILKRKWNNLTHLLLIMIHFPTNKYKPLIKHLCLIIDRMHPVVQENDMTGQFRLVYQAARKTSVTKVEGEM